MNRFIRHAVLPLLTGLSLLSTASAATAPYRVVEFGTLGGAYSSAMALNNLGQVVGESVTADGNTHAFLYSNGKIEDLGKLYGSARGMSINDKGEVVGRFYDTEKQNTRAFYYADGVMHDIFGRSTNQYIGNRVPYDINNSGLIVGVATSNSPTTELRGEMYNSDRSVFTQWSLITPYAINDVGQITGMGSVRGTSGAVLINDGVASLIPNALAGYDINESGMVVGRGKDGYAFAWIDGVYSQPAGKAFGGESTARAVNDGGDIVGQFFETPVPGYRGWLYTGGQRIDLDTLIDPTAGLVIVDALDINNAGQILATACASRNSFFGTNCRTVLLDNLPMAPVPEPASLTLMALGMLTLAWRRRASRRAD